ncbi:sulfatase family protein [Rhodococcoides yunnanense]|uniref:sulfatase family protein n=1 Tax=Rhodococcoides yunnanense TaxID=278209 RepID=UPI000933AE03|nr:sulfatase [Rhodococcus yunnanensis]
MTKENVLVVHWHDLGRHLGAYGHRSVTSPRVDALAAESILFTHAHATAPLCSPSRGSLFSGRYPHSNGLVGLAHHGWEYRPDVQTLPSILSQSGWQTTLFGMQHETSFPSRLGFETFDVSNSFCEYVTAKANAWLREDRSEPFFLTAGFFETHRPYPADRYTPDDASSIEIPDYLPDTPEVREDLAEFHGSITVADAAVGELLDTLAETGLDRTTWVVFMTDHGPAFPRAKSTLYEPGTGIALIVRPPTGSGYVPQVYEDLFSGVDLVPTLLDLLGVPVPDEVEGLSHATQISGGHTPARDEVFTSKTYHDSFDPIRAVRTKDFSYIENYADRPRLDLPWDIEESPSGQAVADDVRGPRDRYELYDLRIDPGETVNLVEDAEYRAIAEDLALRLHTWREETGDVIPSDFVGSRISDRYTHDYIVVHGLKPTSRSPLSADRGIEVDRDL